MRSKLKEIWDLHIEDQKKEYDKIFEKDKNTIIGALFFDEIDPIVKQNPALAWLNDTEKEFDWLVPKTKSYNVTSLDIKSTIELIKKIYEETLDTFKKENKIKGPKNIQKLNTILNKYLIYTENYYIEFIKKKNNYLKDFSTSTFICYEVEKDGKTERKCENYADLKGELPEKFLEGKNEKEYMYVCKKNYCESETKKRQNKVCCKKKNKTKQVISGGKRNKKRKTIKKKY